MYAEITAAMQSAKALGELLKAARSLTNYNEWVAAVSEVNTKLMDATAVALASQEKQSLLAARVIELEGALRRAEDWDGHMKRYALIEFPSTGALAYGLRAGMEDGQPMHYLCAACVDKQQLSRLQPHNHRRFLLCPSCKSSIQVELMPNRKVVSSDPGGSWMGR